MTEALLTYKMSDLTKQIDIQLLRKPAAWFAAQNLKLKDGQLAIESDTLREKTGNGIQLYNDLPYNDKPLDDRITALEGRITTGFFSVLPCDPGITIDGSGRFNYQNDKLKGKSNYLIEALQLNAKFSMQDGVDITYKPTTGSFLILQPGFVLDAKFGLIVWVNSVISSGGADGGQNGDDSVQTELENHETRISDLEDDFDTLSSLPTDLLKKADLKGNNVFEGKNEFDYDVDVLGNFSAGSVGTARIDFGYVPINDSYVQNQLLYVNSTYILFDRINPLTLSSVTGGFDGSVNYVANIGSSNITFQNNALMLMPGGVDFVLKPNQFAVFTNAKKQSTGKLLWICSSAPASISDLPATNGKDAFSTGGAAVLKKSIDDHIANALNPHNTSLEQVRSQNSKISGNIDANGNQIDNLNNPSADQQASTKNYTDKAKADAMAYADSLIVSSIRIAGTLDASTGSFPTVGTGKSGAVRSGDQFVVTVAGTISGLALDVDDTVYALVDAPGQNVAKWHASEHNITQATETMRGAAMVVDTATVSNENTLDDAKLVTSKKLWLNFVPRFVQLGWTWAAKQIYTLAPRFSSVTAGQYLKVDVNKDLTSVSTIPTSDITNFSSSVTGTLLTGLAAVSGSPAATDSILAGFNKALYFITNINTTIANYLSGSTYLDQSGTKVYAVASYVFTSPNDIYTIALTPAITAYSVGLSITVYIGNVNTSAVPLINVNGLGNKSINKANGIAVEVGDMTPGIYRIVYHSTGKFFIESSALQFASDAETQATSTINSTKAISPLRLSNWWTVIKSATQTILVRWAFAIIRLTPGTANATPLNGDLFLDSNNEVNLYDTSFNNKLVKRQGNYSLTGTTTRMVSVSPSGDIGASNDVYDAYVTDSDVQAAITGATYTNGKASITPANSKTLLQGQIYAPAGYFYFAIQDNTVGRIQLS
jgi:hypothetical protein